MNLARPLPTMFRRVAPLVLACGLLAPPEGARAEVLFSLIADGEATDISADGTVVVGRLDQTFEAWRWTPETGVEPLGNAWTEISGGDPGSPDVSRDGSLVSGTFPTNDIETGTPGTWSSGSGWNLLGALGGAAWGMSEDGATIVGLIFESESSAGATRAAAWNRRDGLVTLGDPGRNSCANDANSDGSVVVGWIEELGSGIWQPAAWTSDGPVVLAATPEFCEAKAVSPDGRIIVGQAFDETFNRRVAALWLQSDFGWVQEDLGALSGTLPGYGQAVALDLSADGKVIVGLNRFDRGRSTGIIWTPESGLLDITDFLDRAEVEVPADFVIDAVTGVSDDGATLVGHGHRTGTRPFRVQSFLFHSPEGVGRIADRPGGNPKSNDDPGSHLTPESQRHRRPW